MSHSVVSARSRCLDWAFAIAGGGAAVGTLGTLAWIIWDLIRLGISGITWNFLTGEVESAGRGGGDRTGSGFNPVDFGVLSRRSGTRWNGLRRLALGICPAGQSLVSRHLWWR